MTGTVFLADIGDRQLRLRAWPVRAPRRWRLGRSGSPASPSFAGQIKPVASSIEVFSSWRWARSCPRYGRTALKHGVARPWCASCRHRLFLDGRDRIQQPLPLPCKRIGSTTVEQPQIGQFHVFADDEAERRGFFGPCNLRHRKTLIVAVTATRRSNSRRAAWAWASSAISSPSDARTRRTRTSASACAALFSLLPKADMIQSTSWQLGIVPFMP